MAEQKLLLTEEIVETCQQGFIEKSARAIECSYTMEIDEKDNSSNLTFDPDTGTEVDLPCVPVVIKQVEDYYLYFPMFAVGDKDNVLYVVTAEEHEKVEFTK